VESEEHSLYINDYHPHCVACYNPILVLAKHRAQDVIVNVNETSNRIEVQRGEGYKVSSTAASQD
jgi:hypothetical protein